jgi:hypothetical protein
MGKSRRREGKRGEKGGFRSEIKRGNLVGKF